MATTLTSPGVTVSVDDRTFSATAVPTTVPLIVFATRANKQTPDGTAIAPGTVESNTLRAITSQRELLQAYGNPVFVQSAGEAVHGHETNEYGLLAAHSVLGVNSLAYVLRADIDMGQLTATTTEPTLAPADNTYWLNTGTAVGGIFRWDGSTWNAVPFSIFTTAPTNTDGNDGDWGMDYSDLDGKMVYREGGSWKNATTTNLHTDYGVAVEMSVAATAPAGPNIGDFWYKTSSSAGGTDLKLSRYRASDNTFVTVSVVRQGVAPTPNEGTVWEDTSNIANNGTRPLMVGTGATFIPLVIVASDTQPVSDPDTGTLWYDDTNTDFALYVEGTDVGRGGQWVPIETTVVANPSSTQKVISASAPTFPQADSYWVDISSTANLDKFPVVKKYVGGAWVDVTASMTVSDTDPGAPAVLNSSLWLNTAESKTRNVVKAFDPTWTGQTVVLNTTTNQYEVVAEAGNNWKPASGDKFGRRAVRDIVVEKMQAAVTSNADIRSEIINYQLIAAPGYPELVTEMNALGTDIENRAFVIGDAPKSMIPTGFPTGAEVTVAQWVTNANGATTAGEDGYAGEKSPYSGMYYPWGIMSNVDGESVMMPPSAAMMRVFNQSDANSAVWYPPMGTQRGRVDVFDTVGYLSGDGTYTVLRLNQAQTDVLYENDINPLVEKNSTGLVVWGQKTFYGGATALDRINVSRLVIKIKSEVPAVFERFIGELHSANTYRSATLAGERYMSSYKTQGAVYDYAVVVDPTAADVTANRLPVEIWMKPSRSVEFVYIDLILVDPDADIG